ncbi:glycoside hydrolase family protein [Trypanosoma grayi]|uniref:glycoside hydrolase family protein n=1 Tax=Trypanosoma grayi TaxID=71804 RepID=UPI0004F49291|nr:glycoside hydrolase family protein [Trypanosoma grayi]KEG09366.1 glycoside hydrolase family protein [Trypanosoma grayi]
MKDINSLLSKLTLEEKANLCAGVDMWHTLAVERVGVPGLLLTDGPHGVRKAVPGPGRSKDLEAVPATCFPTAVGMAASWNRELLQEVGRAVAAECQAEDVGVLLGPGANIKRSPLCGRNFEYFSEDPFLSSHMAAALIKGVQSGGVGTSMKHFATNNQETNRTTGSNSVIDERTLREIYLASFEYAVKEAKPWTVMCAYNLLNGVTVSQNEWLLNKVLREEWGFEGLVVSDWGAVDERVDALRAGLDLDMPSNHGVNSAKIVAAVKNGALSENVLDTSVRRILELIAKRQRTVVPNAKYDKEAHHNLARRTAHETLVLLKNKDGLLPLRRHGTHIAVIGEFAKKELFQGGGSSLVTPTKTVRAWDAMCELVDAKNLTFSSGYDMKNDEVQTDLLNEAVKAAKKADVAVLFVGIPHELEAVDRVDLCLPASHTKLIQCVAEAQPNVVVVLSNGAPVEMPWVDCVPAIMEAYLPGQAGGGAMADVLFGVCCPSGKLAETFPKKLRDTPPFPFYPEKKDAVYREGVFVGYRYYDMREIEPLFPFGHGLSYTNFQYSDLVVEAKHNTTPSDVAVSVALTVKNTGKVAGQEIVELYVHDTHAPVARPEKELKEFAKVLLQPGESKKVCFTLDKRSFSYYSVDAKEWRMHDKTYTILVGASSRDIRLQAQVQATKVKVKDAPEIYRNSPLKEAAKYPEMVPHVAKILEKAGIPPLDEGSDMYELIYGSSIRSISRFGGLNDAEIDEFIEKVRLAASRA